MNIVEAYIKKKGKLIILISGLSGSGKGRLSREIERDFNIKRINLDNYYKKNYKNSIKLPNGTTFTNWETVDAYDWDSFNNDINKLAVNGIIATGTYFTNDKIKFTPDFHIHIKISRDQLLEKRHLFIEKKKDKEQYKDLYKLKDTPIETYILDKLVYPQYWQSIKISNINKFFNINNKTIDTLYDEVFNYIIEKISVYLKIK